MQYQEGRICITRRTLYSVKRECTMSQLLDLQEEERVFGVRREMCSTRRVASAVRGEGYAVQRESVQYQKRFISSRRTGCVV